MNNIVGNSGINTPIQEEDTKDIDMEDVEIPLRDDFQDDEVVEGLEESKKMTSAHELTLG